jgi:phosphoribosyl 1,2-cyclic phosphodiesterase
VAFRFASLGSGSKGNGTVVQWRDSSNKPAALLVDCGFSAKEAVLRLAKLGLEAGDLSAILVTHEHGDHIKGVAPLARRFKLPVYMTPGTYHSKDRGEFPDLRLIEGYQPFQLLDLHVTPVAVPHDAREPCQFVFESSGRRLGILTDLGSVSNHVEDSYRSCDALLMEANHDPMMLASGAYPPSLKRRVGGPWGHLSNQQAAAFLQRADLSRLQHLVVAHMSLQNNSLELAQDVLRESADQIAKVTWASQESGFDWLEIA